MAGDHSGVAVNRATELDSTWGKNIPWSFPKLHHSPDELEARYQGTHVYLEDAGNQEMAS